jgi:hypothetical protein
MDMVGGHRLIQDRDVKALPRDPEPMHPACSIASEFQQELLLVASVGDVPDVVWHKEPVGSRHVPLH